MKKRGLAETWLERKREARREMEIELTKDSIELLFIFCKNPDTQFEKKDQYAVKDSVATRDIAALGKFVNDKLFSPLLPADSDDARKLLDAIKDAITKDDVPEDAQRALWSQTSRIFIREALAGKYKLKQKYIERLQSMSKHYSDKTSRSLLAAHFADLDAALDGKPLAKAEDVLDDEEKKEEEKKG